MHSVEQNLERGAENGQCRLLAEVLTATRRMLQHAGAGEWDTVAELERGRREQLERCFAEPFAPRHGELVSEALAVMLHLNEELMSHLAAARNAVLEQGVRQARTRGALGSYQEVQQSPG